MTLSFPEFAVCTHKYTRTHSHTHTHSRTHKYGSTAALGQKDRNVRYCGTLCLHGVGSP